MKKLGVKQTKKNIFRSLLYMMKNKKIKIQTHTQTHIMKIPAKLNSTLLTLLNKEQKKNCP